MSKLTHTLSCVTFEPQKGFGLHLRSQVTSITCMWPGMIHLEMHFNPGQHVLQLQSGLFSILLLKLLHRSTVIFSLSTFMQSSMHQQQGHLFSNCCPRILLALRILSVVRHSAI